MDITLEDIAKLVLEKEFEIYKLKEKMSSLIPQEEYQKLLTEYKSLQELNNILIESSRQREEEKDIEIARINSEVLFLRNELEAIEGGKEKLREY